MVTVLSGGMGYLFLGGGDSNDLIAQHRGDFSLADVANEVRRCHLSRIQVIGAIGARYLHLLVPNKETVARALMPAGIIYEEHGLTPVRQYLAQFPEAAKEIFFRPDILQDFLDSRFYYQTDTHWTFKGAKRYLEEFLVWGGLAEEAQALQTLSLRIDALPFVGDLAQHIGHPGEIQEHVLPAEIRSVREFYNEIENDGRIFHFKNSFRKKKLLLIMDSTGSWALNFMAELFGEVLAVHTADLDFDFLRAFRPTVVIHIQCERFFPRPPQNDANWRRMIEDNENRKHAPVSAIPYFVSQGWLR